MIEDIELLKRDIAELQKMLLQSLKKKCRAF